jgi:hypothetical protein
LEGAVVGLTFEDAVTADALFCLLVVVVRIVLRDAAGEAVRVSVAV